jgi:hypothetical protein
MPSDQQKMYDHASNLVRLLSSGLSEENAVPQIREIVVGKLSFEFSIIT